MAAEPPAARTLLCGARSFAPTAPSRLRAGRPSRLLPDRPALVTAPA
ncbi:hypothetical protein ABZ572_36610 [Streptomyces sp. NPDC018338]